MNTTYNLDKSKNNVDIKRKNNRKRGDKLSDQTLLTLKICVAILCLIIQIQLNYRPFMRQFQLALSNKQLQYVSIDMH